MKPDLVSLGAAGPDLQLTHLGLTYPTPSLAPWPPLCTQPNKIVFAPGKLSTKKTIQALQSRIAPKGDQQPVFTDSIRNTNIATNDQKLEISLLNTSEIRGKYEQHKIMMEGITKKKSQAESWTMESMVGSSEHNR
jgi:hypothetical protein